MGVLIVFISFQGKEPLQCPSVRGQDVKNYEVVLTWGADSHFGLKPPEVPLTPSLSLPLNSLATQQISVPIP